MASECNKIITDFKGCINALSDSLRRTGQGFLETVEQRSLVTLVYKHKHLAG